MKLNKTLIFMAASVFVVSGCSQQTKPVVKSGISPQVTASNAQQRYQKLFGKTSSGAKRNNNVTARVNTRDTTVGTGSGVGEGSTASSYSGAGQYGDPLTDISGGGTKGSDDFGSGAYSGAASAGKADSLYSSSSSTSNLTKDDLSNPKSLLATKVIYFDYNSQSIRPGDYAVLDAHANFLKDYPDITVRLEGHADERGTREYNVALSERRAQSVQFYLKGKGVASSQMETIAYGEEKPVGTDNSEQSWAKNRRVELNYYRY